MMRLRFRGTLCAQAVERLRQRARARPQPARVREDLAVAGELGDVCVSCGRAQEEHLLKATAHGLSAQTSRTQHSIA